MSSRRPRPPAAAVVVVGSYNQDLTWRCREFPRPGETIVGSFTTGPGGKGSNQAVAAARAGAPTAFVTALGDDAHGGEAREFLEGEGLVLRAATKHEPTGNAAILVNERAQNQIIVALGANLALRPRDLPAALLRRARVVVCQLESNLATTAHALRLAHRSGATTVLNPAPMRADFDPQLLRHVEVLVPNESEFGDLVQRVTRRRPEAAALRELPDARLHALCRELGVPVVIVTLGDQGCFVSEPGGATRIRAHDVEAVDTTGAGDAFVGGLAAGLVKLGRNYVEAAHFANAVAALAVMHPGTAPAMPKAREIARFLRLHDHG